MGSGSMQGASLGLGWPGSSLCPSSADGPPRVGTVEVSQAMVQLRRENRLVELHYDAVCEYIGPTDSDED